MNNLTLIPLYDTKAIVKVWKIISEGVREVIAHSLDDISLERVYNEVLSGELLLWTALIDDDQVGFVITKVRDIPFGKRLFVIHNIYLRKPLPGAMFMRGLSILEEYAKSQGCDSLRFYSLRGRALLRKLRRHGWREGYQELVKTL